MKKQCEYCGKQIVFLRSTKRYCDDTCRRLAFYSRQGVMPVNGLKPEILAFNANSGLALNAKNANGDFLEDGACLETESPHDQAVLALNAKDEIAGAFGKNEQSTPALSQPTAVYQRISSPLLNLVEQYRWETSAETIFAEPEYYWGSGTDYVYWVTVRLRCIIENLLRLSMARTVEGKVISQIATALRELVLSDPFQFMPDNYPFIRLTIVLSRRFKELEKQVGNEETTLCLSINRRAELMAAKFAIGEFVPKVSFKSLDFSGKNRNENLKDENEHNDEQQEEAFTRVEQIDPDENADDPAEPNANEQS